MSDEQQSGKVGPLSVGVVGEGGTGEGSAGLPDGEALQQQLKLQQMKAEANARARSAADKRAQLVDGWVEALAGVAGHYRLDCSRENLKLAAAWSPNVALQEFARHLSRQAGLSANFVDVRKPRITPWRLPMIAQLKDGQVLVIRSMNGDELGVLPSGDSGVEQRLALAELQKNLLLLAVMRPARSVPDARVDDYIKPFDPGWLKQLVLRGWRSYGNVMVASMIANSLALTGILFSMQVYDRVIPAQSFSTLYVLFGGVMMATLFAFLMRQARTNIIDAVGKSADLRVSDRVFGHALRVRNSARPKATGTFISQIRELEHVREMMTSTTVAAVADLPFFILFCLLFWYIGGSLVWIPLAAVVAMLLPGILLQPKMRALTQEGMRESSLRNAMLVEAVQGIEDIKVLQAEQRFQNQWNHYNAVSADTGLRLRHLTNSLSNWTQTIQGAVFVVVVCFGAPLVMDGTITTGVLVASSILSSRMLAPLASISMLINRWQSAKVAKESLDNIMKLPVDNPEHQHQIHRASIRGDYFFKGCVFGYEEDKPALRINGMKITAGERIAVLGNNGAGKSTLLQALSGLLEPQQGALLVDDVNLQHIDPADVRRDVALLSQGARLFHGTLRENLRLGAPSATDDELVAVLKAVGAWSFVQKTEKGLDHTILEGGLGLSGGQRQSLLLARLLIRKPQVLLLDEPTASLDETAEQQVIETLGQIRKCTLLVATHRQAILSLVDRVLVVDNGNIIFDGTREQALARLQGRAAGANNATQQKAARV